MTLIDRIRTALGDIRISYRRVFDGVDGSPAHLVLQDLALFCRAHETTMHEDARMHALAEGRREVWLHIQEQLKLSPDQLWSLYVQRKGLQVPVE